jgi:hypothetical protein
MFALDRSMRGTVRASRPEAEAVVEIVLDDKPAAKGEIVLELEPDTKPRTQTPVHRSAPRYGCEPGHGGLAFYLFCVCGCEAYSTRPMQTCPQCHRGV